MENEIFELDIDFNGDDWDVNKSSWPEESLETGVFRKPTVNKPITATDGCVKDKQESIIKLLTNHETRRQETVNCNSPNVVRRKFPGPAGLLPDKKPPRSFNDSSLMLELAEEKRPTDEEPLLCSQTFFSVFNEPPFKRLRKDFELDHDESPLRAITVELIRSKNLKRRKIPFLALALDSIDNIDANGVVLKLRDQTGVLKGVIPAELWKEVEHELKCGAALVLKEVGIINYINCLNITKSNIVAIYTPDNDGIVAVNTKQKTDTQDLARLVAEWQASADATTTPQRTPVQSAPSPGTDLFRLQQPSHTRTPQTKRSSPSEPTARFPKQFRPSTSPPTISSSSIDPAENIDFLMNDDDFANYDFDLENTNQSQRPPPRSVAINNSSVLSQEEATMVNEVLADLDFDDF